MIADIVPSVVAAVEAFDDPSGAVLFPEEETAIGHAVEKRRREFTTVRICARAALASLGLPPAPILRGERGAPIWPVGVVGSMTHCAGYRAAAVALSRDILTIGIDAEVHEALPAGVLELVSLPTERARLRQLATAEPRVCWDRLLFSVKESVYKAWYPLTRRWLNFEEAEVTLDSSGRFTVSLLASAPISGFHGRWLVNDGLVLTAIAMANDGGQHAPPWPERRHAGRAILNASPLRPERACGSAAL